MANDATEILRVFEAHIQPEEHDVEADLGCDVDEFLGFQPDWSFHRDVDERIAADSWMREPAHYSHHAEWRLQEVCASACLLTAERYRPLDPVPLERICVRIVNRSFGSPYHKSIKGYHYVVVPTGYLASVENYWRTHQALAVAGDRVGTPKGSAPQELTSNRIGGASIERCLQADLALWTLLLGDIFTDAIFWDAYDGPFSHPEEIARAMSNVAYEAIVGGIFSSEGRDFRRPPTVLSKRLTRLVLLYVLGHEAAHAMLSHEGFLGRDALTTEQLCDMVSTIHTPIFINRHSTSWDLEIDGAAEYAVGPFGFFTMVEARYTIGMVMDKIVNDLKDGTPRAGEWADRFREIQTRSRGQVKLLESILGKTAPDILDTLESVRLEIEATLIGIKMLGMRLALNRENSFASVFLARRANEIS